MVNVKRIEFSHDGVTFTETFSNNQYITTIIEEDSIVTDEGFSYGDTPTIATLTLRYAGTNAQVAEMLSYKHMRVYVNNVLVFSGYNPSNDEEVISSEYRQGSATYSSYASYFETVTFESDIYYSQPDGIKVCDPQDTSHSLVHIISNMLFETAPQAFTLECSYRDTTVVPTFTASIGDSIYSVLCELLEQAGLTFYIKSYTLYVIDMLEEPSGVASNIIDFESGMQLSEKAYESKTLPMIRTCSYHTVTDITIGTQFTKEQKIVVNPHASIEAPVSLKYDAGDNTEVVLYTPTDVSLVGATEGIISGYGVVLRSWEKTASNQITAQVYNEHAIFNYSYRNIKVTGNVVYLDYNNLVVPQFSDTNMSFTVQRNEEKTNYLSSTSQALRYLRALLYGKYMDAKTYTVYTTINLNLNDFCTIHGESGYYRVIQKQCAYDHFGGYTYTVAAIYNDAGLHYAASYVAPVADLPAVSPGIVLEASRYTVEYDPNGRLLSNIPIRITLRSLNTFLNPTLRINGEAVTPALAPSDSGTTDATTVGDSGWYYDVDPHYFDTRSEMIVSADINYSNYTAIRIVRASLQPVKIIQQYYVSTSTEEPSGGTWLDTKPLTYNGYLWRRTGTVYTDGSIVYEEPYYILAPRDISYTSVVEYAVSSSSETFVFPDAVIGYSEDTLGADDFEFGFKNYAWSSDIGDWYKGLYVWTRTVITDANGTVTYGEPTYCKDLTESLYASCKFELTPTSEHFLVNKADHTSQDTYTVVLTVTGLSPTDLINPITSASVVGPLGPDPSISGVTVDGLTITFTIDRDTDLKQLTITANGLYGETASCRMIFEDVTQYAVYGGVFASNADATAWFENNCGGLVEGYSFVDSSQVYAIKVWYNGQWMYLGQSGISDAQKSEICGKAQKDVLSAIQAGSVTLSDYAYFNVVVAGVVTADYVKSLKGVFEDVEVSGSISVDHEFVMKGVFLTDRYYPQNFF